MLKEYILKMQKENNDKVEALEREMRDLIQDLNCSEEIIEKLQRDKKSDTNIFSPRTIDTHSDDKIKEKQNEIKQIKQRIEYVSQMIEEGLKIRNEYQQIEEEMNTNNSYNLQNNNIHVDFEKNNIEEDIIEEDIIDTNNSGINDKTIGSDIDNNVLSSDKKSTSSEMNVISNDREKNELNNENNKNNNLSKKEKIVSEDDKGIKDKRKKEMLDFLNTIYKRNEISLAYLNSNRNKCRSEIKSTMNMIRDFAKKVENEEL